jgi:hypothetical protein
VWRLCALPVRLTFDFYLLMISLIRIFVTDSIVRAFLIEEAKVVKRVIKSQQKAAGGRS